MAGDDDLPAVTREAELALLKSIKRMASTTSTTNLLQLAQSYALVTGKLRQTPNGRE